MSLSLIQIKNREIIEIVKDIPGILDTVYEKINADNEPFEMHEYIGIPNILITSGKAIHDTLNLSAALCQTVCQHILRNPGFQSNEVLCSCINIICDEIQLMRTRL